MANWNPPKVNPFAGLFGGQKPQKAEPPRRVSMRAMKAVDLKKLSADDVLEVDEFSIAEAAEQQEQFEREAAQAQQEQHAKKKGQDPKQAQAQAQAKPQAPPQKPANKMPALSPQAFGAPQAARTSGPNPAVTKLPPRPVDQKFTALVALDNAKDSGVFFVEDQKREGHSEEQEDPELREAVEECIRLLFGVQGIHHVGPGKNEKNEPVIVVAAGEGFSHDSMKAVPERVHRFATLVALPFDLVPLRRNR